MASQTTVTGIILGSGWPLPQGFETEQTLPLSAIWPEAESSLPDTEIPGHTGQIFLGHITNHPVCVVAGRRHLYQGYTAPAVALSVRWLKQKGITRLVLTNAAGGINQSFLPGDLMLITDQLNLTGQNPLAAQQPGAQAITFMDTQNLYAREWKRRVERRPVLGLTVHEGVYAGLVGPSYETPAEVRMLATLGADAVGMSTVLEALQAHALGLEVLGVSFIANYAARHATDEPLTHEDVLHQTRQKAELLAQWLRSAVQQ